MGSWTDLTGQCQRQDSVGSWAAVTMHCCVATDAVDAVDAVVVKDAGT